MEGKHIVIKTSHCITFIGFLVSVFGISFLTTVKDYGALSQKVDDMGASLVRIERKLDDHISKATADCRPMCRESKILQASS